MRKLILLSSGLLIAPALTLAQEAVQLQPMVVTPTRSAEALDKVPYTAHQIDADTLQLDRMVRTVPEALKFIPGVVPQKTGHAQGSPFIRGFTGFRTLFMIDGIRLNNSVFRDGPNQYWGTVDPYSIERLEVLKGPASSLYGSDAIGGSVNAISPSAFDGLNDQGYGLRSLIRWASAEDSFMYRQEGSLALGKNRAARAGVTVKDFGDLESGGGELPGTGYDEWDLDGAVESVLGEYLIWKLVHQTVRQDDAPRTHRTVNAVPFEGTTVGDELVRELDQDRHLTYLRVETEDVARFTDRLSVTGSWQRQEEERFRLRSRDRRDEQGFTVDSYGLLVNLEKGVAAHRLAYGVEYYRDEVDSFKNTLNPDGRVTSSAIQGPVGDDSSYDNLGVYIQDQLQLNDAVDVLGGLRYSWFQANVGTFENPETGEADSFKNDWHTVTANLRGTLRPGEEGSPYRLFAGVAQGFRAPNLSDLSRLDSARSDEIETASTDLDPEEFVTLEIGARLTEDGGHIQASAYYTWIDDLIVRTPTGRIIDGDQEVTKKNGGEGYVAGVELSASYHFTPRLSAQAAFAWMDGEVETFPSSDPVQVEEPIDRLMPATGHVLLRYQLNNKLWLGAELSTADDADTLSSRDKADTQRIPPGGTPGYQVVSLRGGWRCSENLQITAAVENIVDENYRVHGSGLNEPGRNVVVAVEGKL